MAPADHPVGSITTSARWAKAAPSPRASLKLGAGVPAAMTVTRPSGRPRIERSTDVPLRGTGGSTACRSIDRPAGERPRTPLRDGHRSSRGYFARAELFYQRAVALEIAPLQVVEERRRRPTSISRPRRELWSLPCSRRCPVRWLMRSVSSAIWTLVEPCPSRSRRMSPRSHACARWLWQPWRGR